MDILELVLAVEQGADEYTEEEILEAIRDHKETLRNLQGSWGRLICDLEEQGEV